MSDNKHINNITMRYFIKGVLTLQSPMIIANGENEIADLQIVRDWDNNIFIPATTLAGNIRHILAEYAKNDKIVEKYFGSADDESGHSLFSFFDANGIGDITTDIRDGVKLDNLTKTTEDGSKYDYEIINESNKFNYRMEVVSRNSDNNELEAITNKIIKLLENEELRIGAKTSRGFGKIKLSDTKIQKIDIVAEQQKWIDFDWEKLDGKYQLNSDVGLFDKLDTLKISAKFAIPDSLIINHIQLIQMM